MRPQSYLEEIFLKGALCSQDGIWDDWSLKVEPTQLSCNDFRFNFRIPTTSHLTWQNRINAYH